MAVQVSKKHTFTGHRGSLYTLQKAGAPHHFFSAGGDGLIVLWDLETCDDGQLIAQLPNTIYSLHYLSDKNLLVAGQNFSGIHLIDYQNKKEIASLQLTSSAIFDIQSYQNDLLVATGDGQLLIVDIGRLVVKSKIHVSQKSARTIAVNPLSGEMAVGFSDHKIRIFDLEQYKLKTEIDAHLNSVFTVAYSPDGNILISGSRDARLKAWDVQAGYSLCEEVAAHIYAINHLVFSPDGRYVATGSMDKTVKVWNATSLKLLKVIDKSRHGGHAASVNKLLWTPYKNQLLSAGDDRIISAWDLLFL
ncbi:MAG: WD40 repeat domain-containing protein [Bacteroidetes bacterium]|nr:WD40 repeat domain-containing protein [Bacteroidota bacterium]MBS1539414.1 WD40 repeat domain-containing protein [Bacteroidota bacterium]